MATISDVNYENGILPWELSMDIGAPGTPGGYGPLYEIKFNAFLFRSRVWPTGEIALWELKEGWEKHLTLSAKYIVTLGQFETLEDLEDFMIPFYWEMLNS